LSDREVRELAELVRRSYGDRLPPAPVRESVKDREVRMERTKYVIETDLMTLVNESRLSQRLPSLSRDDEDRVVVAVVGAMFLIPQLMSILAAEPLAEDAAQIGSGPLRVDRADGTVEFYPSLVDRPEQLQAMISDVAQQHHRPFSQEAPFVDVQLNRHLRFHGQGFDVVAEPAIFIRVHRAMGATYQDLFEWGSLTRGLAYFLGEVSPAVKLSQAVTGVQGSGKTTVLRASALAYPSHTRIATVETDFELGLAGLGMDWTQEMQARIPVTSDADGISCADLMRPLLRTRADVNIIGEVRGDEASSAVRAANVGQGTLVTVHGTSAEVGLGQLVDRMVEADGMDRALAQRLVYESFDLVVHCEVAANRRRWIKEVIAPSVEGDQVKYHTLYGPDYDTGDERARARHTPWPARLLAKINMSMPDFDHERAVDDTLMAFPDIGTGQGPAARAV
jgi:pilus assembly protein CpaF